MQRDVRLIGAAAVAIAAVAAPALVVARALPHRTVTEVVATPLNDFFGLPVVFDQEHSLNAIPLAKAGAGSQRLELDTPRFPRFRDVKLQIAVATYLRAPTETLQLELLGPRGERLGFCRIPPSHYHDNAAVYCPVSRPERLRHVVVSANGQAPLAVYAAKLNDRLVTGALVRQPRLDGVGDRLDILRRWLGVLRPPLFSPVALLVYLTLSMALLGAAFLAMSWTGAGGSPPDPASRR